MNESVKQLWVNKLRDPSVKQGRHCLKEGNEFCCLGVLTELYRTSADNTDGINWSATHRQEIESFEGTSLHLPTIVKAWAGLSGPVRVDVPKNLIDAHMLRPRAALEDLNDAGVPFAVIADLIEAQL